MGVPHFAQNLPSTGAPQLAQNAMNDLFLYSRLRNFDRSKHYTCSLRARDRATAPFPAFARRK
jgi:hypothetical protein